MFELIHMQLLFYLSKEGDVYVLIKKEMAKKQGKPLFLWNFGG